MKKSFYLLLAIVISCSCKHDINTEKHQNKRANVLNIREKVKEIQFEEMLIGNLTRLSIIGDYLVVGDYKSLDNLIHLFDKNTFKYVGSTATMGQGPGEISNMGYIATDEPHRMIYVSDHGKQKIFGFEIDSILANSVIMPKVKMTINEKQFPSEYQYINDTLCIARIIEPIGNADFKPIVGKWNMKTGEIKLMKYEHPDVKKKRMTFAVSMEHGIYVECYSNYDLITICDLNGELMQNIYGPKWDYQEQNSILHYGSVLFCDNRIIAAYSGKDRSPGTSSYATMFFVFDISGNYLQTLNLGYNIVDFCYDKENNRIIMNLNDEIQFAYLDLDGIIS